MAEITQEQVVALRALGEAAVNVERTIKRCTCPMSVTQRAGLEEAESALMKAARAYAQSIKGEDHGK